MHQYIEEKIKLEINMPSMTQPTLKQKITDAINTFDGSIFFVYDDTRHLSTAEAIAESKGFGNNTYLVLVVQAIVEHCKKTRNSGLHQLLEITAEIFVNNFEQDKEVMEIYKQYLQKFALSEDVEVIKNFCAGKLDHEIFVRQKLDSQGEETPYAETSNAALLRFSTFDESDQYETISDETNSNLFNSRFSSCVSFFSKPEIKAAVTISCMITGIGLMILGAASCASGNVLGVIALGIGLSLFLASVAMHCKCTPRSDSEAKSILTTRLGI